jgi:hypothetical protein
MLTLVHRGIVELSIFGTTSEIVYESIGKHLQGLKKLNIQLGKVKPDCLAMLFDVCNTIEELHIEVDGKETFEALGKLGSLKSLFIASAGFTDSHLEPVLLSNKLENLTIRSSHLNSNTVFTGSCFLQAQCGNLKTLELTGLEKITDDGVARILKCYLQSANLPKISSN